MSCCSVERRGSAYQIENHPAHTTDDAQADSITLPCAAMPRSRSPITPRSRSTYQLKTPSSLHLSTVRRHCLDRCSQSCLTRKFISQNTHIGLYCADAVSLPAAFQLDEMLISM